MPRFLIALLLAVFLVACAPDAGEAPASDDGLSIAVVPKSVSFDFWSKVRDGAEAAAEELSNVTIIWNGPNAETDIAGQVNIVEGFINQNVDALVIAPSDAQGLVRVLRQAEEAGIPVVTIDSNTDPQISRAFVATNNREAAARAADLIAEALDGTGKVALIPYIAGASTSIEREEGFRERLADYPGLELVAVQYSNSDIGQAMSVTEDILTAHPDLDAIFAANEPSVLGAAQALKSRDLAGDVVLVGFDASPREIAGVRDGSIHALIVQSPFTMGYEGVMQAVRAIRGETTDTYTDSGNIVVTTANVDSLAAAS